MPYDLFSFLHIVAAILLVAFTFSAFADPSSKRRKQILTWSGIASLLVLITGLGMGHEWGFPGWFFAKILIWLAISAFAGVVFRRKAWVGPLKIATLVLVILAVWLVVYKPF